MERMIVVNGSSLLCEAEDIAALLVRLGYGHDPAGVAVAVNGRVVPRSRWQAEPLAQGDAVEVVGAVQGG